MEARRRTATAGPRRQVRPPFDRPQAGRTPRPGDMVDSSGPQRAPMMQHGPNTMATAVALSTLGASPPRRLARTRRQRGVSASAPGPAVIDSARKHSNDGSSTKPGARGPAYGGDARGLWGTAAVRAGVVYTEGPRGVPKAPRRVAHRRRGWRPLGDLTLERTPRSRGRRAPAGHCSDARPRPLPRMPRVAAGGGERRAGL